MRVLWITNGPIAVHRQQLGGETAQGGGWMDAAFNEIKDCEDIEIGLATIYPCQHLLRHEGIKVKMYAVPNDIKRGLYDYENKKNIQLWKEIASDFKPDVIHIWGTEMAHSLCALQAMSSIPAVVYLQGLMVQIFHHGDAGIDFVDRLKNTTIRDFIEERGIHRLNNFEKKRTSIERLIIQRANNIILENDWSAINCKAINPDCCIFRSLLPINKHFADYEWQAGGMEPHSIFTVAGGYPIKGHHILLRALAIIKKWYPDVKLYIPGYNPLNDDKGLRRLFAHGYTKHVKSLIKKYDLSGNIIYTGKLSMNEMASYMSRCNVFVMPSAIENHSSTLIEAMMVGAPCVSSYVGGVSEYLKDGINGFMYRYDEYETLAGLVSRLFDNPEIATVVGRNAMNSSRNERLSINVVADFISVYNTIRK